MVSAEWVHIIVFLVGTDRQPLLPIMMANKSKQNQACLVEGIEEFLAIFLCI